MTVAQKTDTMHALNAKTGVKGRNPRRKIVWKRWIPLYIMGIPGLAYIFINNLLPLVGMQLAFRELDYSRGIFGGRFVGLQNFEFLFTTSDAWIMTRNTVLYNLLFIAVDLVFGIGVAILFNEIRCRFAQKLYQSLILIPYFMSMVIVSYLGFAFLSHESGFINNTLLKALGIEPVMWYSTPVYWPFILTFFHVWKGIGYSLLAYTARLLAIDTTYYEAAKIDGATKWQQIRHITLPLLKPVIIMMVTLSIGRMFYSDFGLFYQIPMNSGTLYDITTTIDVYAYRALMKLGDVTMSSAVGVYQSLVGFILIILANMIVRKFSKDDALF